MTEIAPPRDLGARLRELRRAWNMTQGGLSSALGLSGALISSWENGSATPPEERLNAYARFFASPRSLEQRPPRLIPSEDLTSEEERVRSDLIEELVRLREEQLGGGAASPKLTGALGGRFFYFPDGQPISIFCTPLSQNQLGYTPEAGESGSLSPAVQYATNPSHPNWVRNLGNGDIDSLLELVGHIRAENPTAEVSWRTYDRVNAADQLTGHVILLGGADANIGVTPTGDPQVMAAFFRTLDLPVHQQYPPGADDEVDGEFAVSIDGDGNPTADPAKVSKTEVYRPRFLRDEATSDRPRLVVRGAPQLTADLALVVRTRNPLNPTTTLTSFSGIFSRGTYGAIRAFTDAQFRTRNEQWLHSAMDPDNFWLLLQVAVFADNTMTPDLSRAANRLRTSS